MQFFGCFNKTVIPLALVGYEIVTANEARTISYPTRAHGIVKYQRSNSIIGKGLFIWKTLSVQRNLQYSIGSLWSLSSYKGADKKDFHENDSNENVKTLVT